MFSKIEWIEVLKDLNAGTIGGVTGIVAGYPIDTVKVHLQTSNLRTQSIPSLFRSINKSSGLFGLYKGMTSPILSNAPINAIVFGVYGETCRFFQKKSQQGLSKMQIFVAGSLAGFIQTLVSAPSDLIKIQLQVGKEKSKGGSIRYAKYILDKHGLYRGLFYGWGITVLRDVPSFGVYFCTYEYAKDYFSQWNMPHVLQLLLAGGIAGTASWASIHPLDVVKSCVQSQSLTNPLPLRQILQQKLKDEGPMFFMKGFSASVLRAFPVSAVTFIVYEKFLLWTR